MEAGTTTLDLELAAAEAVPPVPDPDEMPVILGVPLNRLLTIARGPINIVAASIATWLLVHVHVLGLAHVQHDGLSTGIAQGFVWLVTAVLTDRGIAQWVKGHHLQMSAQGNERAAAVAAVASAAPAAAGAALAATAQGTGEGGHPDGEVYNEAEARVEELVPEGVPKVAVPEEQELPQ